MTVVVDRNVTYVIRATKAVMIRFCEWNIANDILPVTRKKTPHSTLELSLQGILDVLIGPTPQSRLNRTNPVAYTCADGGVVVRDLEDQS
jgi:hypothetical protein